MAREDTQFRTGKANPSKGRAKGSRNKITKKYLDSLLKAYDPDVIDKIKEKRPDVYIKLYSQLVPKDLDVVSLVLLVLP